jgi:hypothetical protein
MLQDIGENVHVMNYVFTNRIPRPPPIQNQNNSDKNNLIPYLHMLLSATEKKETSQIGLH